MTLYASIIWFCKGSTTQRPRIYLNLRSGAATDPKGIKGQSKGVGLVLLSLYKFSEHNGMLLKTKTYQVKTSQMLYL